jgi:hypothetical protein
VSVRNSRGAKKDANANITRMAVWPSAKATARKATITHPALTPCHKIADDGPATLAGGPHLQARAFSITPAIEAIISSATTPPNNHDVFCCAVISRSSPTRKLDDLAAGPRQEVLLGLALPR